MNLGNYIIDVAQLLQKYSTLLIQIAVFVLIVLIAIRMITDWIKMNPFSNLYHALRRPTDSMINNMRSSQYYFPLKKSFGFDPSAIMLLVSAAIAGYVLFMTLGYFFTIISLVGRVINAFSYGELFTAVRYSIGTVLLAAIFFLMALMTIIFVNWIFGLLSKYAYWAMDRLAPLLKIFEFGGIFANFSFLILGIALTFAYSAVSVIFFG